MSTIGARPPLQPGEPAPDFTLPLVGGEGTVSLADYRGKHPVLLALFRGLWCPFCRRAIVQMGTTQAKLAAIGVQTLGVVATSAEKSPRLFADKVLPAVRAMPTPINPASLGPPIRCPSPR